MARSIEDLDVIGGYQAGGGGPFVPPSPYTSGSELASLLKPYANHPEFSQLKSYVNSSGGLASLPRPSSYASAPFSLAPNAPTPSPISPLAPNASPPSNVDFSIDLNAPTQDKVNQLFAPPKVGPGGTGMTGTTSALGGITGMSTKASPLYSLAQYSPAVQTVSSSRAENLGYDPLMWRPGSRGGGGGTLDRLLEL